MGAAEEYFTGLLFSSFLLCIASINLNRSAAAAKDLKAGREKSEDKAWEEVKRGNYLDTESEGGRTSQGRESNKWRETDLESEDREQGLSEG